MYPSLFLLFCCNFLTQTTGYFTEINPEPTIATSGRIVSKIKDGYLAHDTRRNMVPQFEVLNPFRIFLRASNFYADKSNFIAEVLNDKNRVIRILRPRRWGKTLNLNMLEKFFEVEVDDAGNEIREIVKQNRALFCGSEEEFKKLQICDNATSMAEFGIHPVISISLKDIRGNSYKEMEKGFKDRLATTFQKHHYLVKYVAANETLLPLKEMKDRLLILMEGDPHLIEVLGSIRVLTELLYMHYGNSSLVYFLVDDFDSPIINGYSAFGHNKTEFQDLCALMKGFLSLAINENEFLAKVVITSTYRLYLGDEFAGLSDITEYNLLEDGKYAEYFGFREQDVKDALQVRKISTPIDEVRKWYGGYGGVIEGMYNPKSVMEFIRNDGQFGVYILPKVNDSFVSEILATEEVKTTLKEALSKEISVRGDEADLEIDLAENYMSKSIVLLCNGILTPTTIDLENEVLGMKLPNEEARELAKRVLA